MKCENKTALSGKKFESPKLTIHATPSNKFVIDNQCTVMMNFLIGGSLPTGYYFFNDGQEENKDRNEIVLFCDGLLWSAKFKQIPFVRRFCETLNHEYFHAFVIQETGKNWPKEEFYAKIFATEYLDPPPMRSGSREVVCKCGKKTYWPTCPVCSIELIEGEECEGKSYTEARRFTGKEDLFQWMRGEKKWKRLVRWVTRVNF